MADSYDIVVLGGGPAGYPAAIRAARKGARVCLIEQEALGGTCLNWGCIPTKTLHALAHLVERAGAGRESGARGALGVDAPALFTHKARVVADLVTGVERLLKARSVDIVRGTGRMVGPDTIEVEGAGAIGGQSLIVATGSSEMPLPGIGIDGRQVLGSRELLDLGRIPESMLVIGGGVIGCEFASIFNALGSRVTIVEMLPQLIATEDMQVSRYLQTFMKRKGVTVHLGTKVASIETGPASVTAVLEDGTEVAAEVVLVSVGRRPNVAGIGLEGLGVEVERAGIKTDGRMRTTVGGIFAAGDVTGGLLLAHVATLEGIIAMRNALGEEVEMDYAAVPTTIYTLPEIARVGLSEHEAEERDVPVKVGRFPFAANGKAKGLGEEEGFVKWIVAEEGSRLLGLHIIGPQATELVAAGIIAIERGMTVNEFTAAVFPHPTLSESLMEAAEAVEGTAIHIL